MKKISLIILSIFMLFVITACGDDCDHAWSEWVTIKNPTCVANGQREHTCSICSKTEKDSIEKLGHSFGAAYAKNEDGHYHFCEICSYEEDYQTHNLETTELGNVKCSVCEYLYSENKNSFYNNLFKINKGYIIELQDFLISEDMTEIINGQLNIVTTTGAVDGYAIILPTDNSYQVLVEGTLQLDNNSENGIAKLNCLFDGENVYMHCTLDSTEMDEEIYSAKVSYDKFFDTALSLQMDASELLPVLEKFSTLSTSLFNIAENELIQKLVEFLFEKTQTIDGYSLELNLNKVIELVNYIANKPLNSIFNKLFGEGQYELSKQNLIKLIDSKLSTIVKMLKIKYDIDIKQVLIDVCTIMGEDPSNIEVFFNSPEYMNKSLVEILQENEQLTREEIICEIEDFFYEVEHFVPISSSDVAPVIDVLSSVNESIDLVINTDKNGFIENVNANINFDLIDDVKITGGFIISEYNNLEEFNKKALETIKLYEESIPTFGQEEFDNVENTTLTITDTKITIQIKEKCWYYEEYIYSSFYYYEYRYLTFDFDDVFMVLLEDYMSTQMDNSKVHRNDISFYATCSGKTVSNGQLYNYDGTEAHFQYSLDEEKTLKDQMVEVTISYVDNEVTSIHTYLR